MYLIHGENRGGCGEKLQISASGENIINNGEKETIHACG
jgi:hypothetical protein